MKRWFYFVFSLFSALGAFAAQTQTRLLLSAETARAGETIWAGLEMKMPLHWHTYWRNGGDSGSPTTIQWTLPKGVEAGEIQWPIPEKLISKIGDVTLITYVYNDKIVLPIPLKLAADLPLGSLQLAAKVKWQECDELCVLGKSDVQATLTIGGETKLSSDAPLIEEWRKKLPGSDAALKANVAWEQSNDPKSRPVVIEWKTPDAPADFYPYGGTGFDVGGATELLPKQDGKVRLKKIINKADDGDWPKSLAGIFVAKTDSPDVVAIELNLPIGVASAAPARSADGASASPAASASLITMLLFAFIGGLILNIMPCVLPVIALKVLGFVNQAKEAPERVRKLGLIYGLGVLVSFFVLAALAIAAQKAGGIAGWGSAFRNPQFRFVITILITLVTLNLFGIFEVTLSGRAMGAASDLTNKSGGAGAFFNGVLATVLATPCTAPFLGVALGFAFTQAPLIIVLIFLCVGLGLALPFVVLCWEPRLLKFLPKPGAWMEKFKIAMGFPMLATAIWLLWLSASGDEDVLWFGLFLVVLSLIAWIWGQFVQRGSRRKSLAVIICLLFLALDYGFILEGQLHWRAPAGTASKKIDWKPWSPEAVEKARRDGHPVLVDFTAKSCLNCRLNKLSSLEIDSTRAKLKEIGAVALKGDFSNEDPAIAQELRRYQSAGVPLNLVYPKDSSKEPIVLPPILTPSIVLEALERAK